MRGISRFFNLGTAVGAVFLAAALGLAVAHAEDAKQADAKPADTGNPWVINCSTGTTGTDLQCQVSQNLTESKTGQRVLTVTIRKQPDGSMAMLLALPHGLFLPAGTTYQIDSGAKTTVAIQTSDQNGAYAAVPLTADLLTALKAGTTLNIGMESVTRKTVSIPVTLAGFTATVQKLQSIK